MGLFSSLRELSNKRVAESTLSILGIADNNIRKHLEEMIIEGGPEQLVSEPVFEHTCGWETCDQSMQDLAGNILTQELVNNLDSVETYSFPADLKPYTHQKKAWEILTQNDPKSIIVTTGTGSGKTECFMIPIIDDLIKEYKIHNKPLVGIRALFLYPLNALINSQQERLDSWTKPFETNIRYCLYNGNTVETHSKVKEAQKEKPNEILSRELLRKEPAPILMTNVTMLEYMLVRQIDNPIIEQSKKEGSLRWIVLDEAHTYVGSQAAEISLLLRRVVQAFGKDSNDIRFIATSATIADKESNQKLATYLADLAGVPEENVFVITGRRVWEPLPDRTPEKQLTLEQLLKIETDSDISNKRYSALCNSKPARIIRNCFIDNDKPLSLSRLYSYISNYLLAVAPREKHNELLCWIDLLCRTKKESVSQSFLPLRMHLFQRMLHGLWVCINPRCPEKSHNLSKWPFGTIYTKHRVRCSCGAPVYELAFCRDCNTPYLIAVDRGGVVRQLEEQYDDEEELLDSIAREGDEIGTPVHKLNKSGRRILIASSYIDHPNYISQGFNLRTAEIGGFSSELVISIMINDTEEELCAVCNSKSTNYNFYRRLYLGSSFYTTTIVPTILEHCPDASQKESEGKSPEELPGRGRKLITFTDSRQGTARLALSMQQEAERSKLRGAVFYIVKSRVFNHVDDMKQDQLIKKKKEIINELKEKNLMKWIPDFEKEIEDLVSLKDPYKKFVEWDDMVQNLAEQHDIRRSILQYNKYANPVLFDSGDNAKTMARILLLREFIRRPKNQNSLETLGLMKVSYKNLDDINKTPLNWEEIQIATKYQSANHIKETLTLEDWKNYLKVVLDFYVRENSFVEIEDTVKQWMGMRFYPKYLSPPDSPHDDTSGCQRWPTIENSPRGLRNRLVKLLLEATDLDIETQKGKDLINIILNNAWQQLAEYRILDRKEDVYQLRPSVIQFSLNNQAWICPITHRLLDTTFCGITPYLPQKISSTSSYACEKVTFPDFSEFNSDSSSTPYAIQMRRIIDKNPDIKSLRSKNLWTDISDKTVEGGFYYRTAEHSAQQSPKRLKDYESLFKKGLLNVLNCSTTMEMGVDIGGVSAIVMNNVPPHPANYLQRTGRAGRRGESQSIAYTLCKQDAHNQQAFNNPMWPFITKIEVPTISLSSRIIVHRHVNSFLLSRYLLEEVNGEKQNHTLQVGWFFDGEPSFCDRFVTWIEHNHEELSSNIRQIIRGTALSSTNTKSIFQETQYTLLNLQTLWKNENERILHKLKALGKSEDLRKAIEIELSRHQSQYLLKELAEKAFLPGYGFPTHVVNFYNYNILDFINKKKQTNSQISREDNIFNYKESPSRSLDIAIREYAPGSTLVIDGRVYRSSGVYVPKFEANKKFVFNIFWKCSACGHKGLIEHAYSNDQKIFCTKCGTQISSTNKHQILRPSGFAQDFYDELGNDVSTQRFVKALSPQVQLDGVELSLPDPRCGSFQYGENGTVFYHSAGEYDNGYAICLKCGRAESMTNQNELPKVLNESKHRPLHMKPQKFGSDKVCSKEHVRKNIYLGYSIRTDVVEFYLKNPETGLWLGADTEHSRKDVIIALTLALAIRNSIAKRLGISTIEMGYSHRIDRELINNNRRIALQIFDTASGGAGFVKAGIDPLYTLLKEAIQELDCPNNCDTACSQCLAAQDSRINHEDIDRNLAKQWLEDTNYEAFMINPKDLYDIPNPKYCTFGPEATILTIKERTSRKEGFIKINFFIESLSDKCDLLNEKFYNRIMAWRYHDKIDIELTLKEDQIIDEKYCKGLGSLAANGVRIMEAQESDDYNGLLVFCQIFDGSNVITIFTDQEDDRVPGANWIHSDTPSTWISSNSIEPISSKPIQIPSVTTKNASSFLISINSEFDGRFETFKERVENHLFSSYPVFKNSLACDVVRTIEYSDRYLRSPWVVMLISEFFRVFCSKETEKITLVTTLNGRERYSPNKIFHDWMDKETTEKVSMEWINFRTGVPVKIQVENNLGEVAHAREMVLNWKSGARTILIFDQGAGPWKCNVKSYRYSDFNFYSIEDQFEQMKDKVKVLSVQRDEPWKTYITVDHKS